MPTVAHDQVAPVRLDWEGITCELKLKTKEGSKNLLSQVRALGRDLGVADVRHKGGKRDGRVHEREGWRKMKKRKEERG